MSLLPTRRVIAVFGVLAFGYFLSSVMRGATGTLAPTLAAELHLNAGQLGLLGGSYFLGFAAMQLPAGAWLDRRGPRHVLVGLLAVAVIGCVAFALANSFWSLIVARLLGGVGVSACLMAPLAGYRTWLAPEWQGRASSWMLMIGALGLVAATLPVQWALPLVGWRPLFVILAALCVWPIVGTAWQLPGWTAPAPHSAPTQTGYAPIVRNRYFQRIAPLALISYGSMMAVQTLWATQWMIHVSGYSADQAADGLFAINLAMLAAHWLWGTINPALARAGMTPDRLLRLGVPLGVGAIAAVAVAGEHAGWAALATCLALTSFLSMSHPAVAMAIAPHEAARGLIGYNLLLFSGAFAWQWAIGLVIDRLRAWRWSDLAAYRAAFGLLAACAALSYLWFLGALGRSEPSRR